MRVRIVLSLAIAERGVRRNKSKATLDGIKRTRDGPFITLGSRLEKADEWRGHAGYCPGGRKSERGDCV